MSQLHRSPGVFFEHDRGKTHSSGKLLFSARVIPYRGSWLDFEFDPKDFLFFRVDRRRKMPVTTLLKAIGLTQRADPRSSSSCSTRSTCRQKGVEFEFVPERLRGEMARFDIIGKDGKVIVAKDKRITAQAHPRAGGRRASRASPCPTTTSLGRTLAHERRRQRRPARCIAKANDEITESCSQKLRTPASSEIQTIYTNDLDQGPYISQTLRIDDTPDQYAAQGRDLPHDASRRAADRRRGRGAVPRPVLRRGALRPVGRRPDEVQPPRRPRRARTARAR